MPRNDSDITPYLSVYYLLHNNANILVGYNLAFIVSFRKGNIRCCIHLKVNTIKYFLSCDSKLSDQMSVSQPTNNNCCGCPDSSLIVSWMFDVLVVVSRFKYTL